MVRVRRSRVLLVTFILFWFICLFIIIIIYFFANRKIRKVLTGVLARVLALMLFYLRFLDLYQDGKGGNKQRIKII